LDAAGPDDLRSLLTATFVLVTAGMVIGVLGHITQLKPVVATGIALVFAGAACFVVAVGQFG
jgi:predicted branched-subunit amino acid permease